MCAPESGRKKSCLKQSKLLPLLKRMRSQTKWRRNMLRYEAIYNPISFNNFKRNNRSLVLWCKDCGETKSIRLVVKYIFYKICIFYGNNDKCSLACLARVVLPSTFYIPCLSTRRRTSFGTGYIICATNPRLHIHWRIFPCLHRAVMISKYIVFDVRIQVFL